MEDRSECSKCKEDLSKLAGDANVRLTDWINGTPILHVDATPDANYPLRILKAYHSNCDTRWVANPPRVICEVLNKAQDERKKILDRAIAVLEKDLSGDMK